MSKKRMIETANTREANDMARRIDKTRTLGIGSISSGTMREEDLIPAFMDALESVDHKRARKIRYEYRKVMNFIDGTRETLANLEYYPLSK